MGAVAVKEKPKKPGQDAAKGARRKTSPEILERFAEIFNSALDERDVPRLHLGRHVSVAKRYNVSISAARKWVTGESLPDTDNLIHIAKDLGYTIDMMLGEEKAEKRKIMVAFPFLKPNDQGKPEYVHFDDAILDPGVRLKFNDIAIYVIDNDEMAPAFNAGDYAFIDTSEVKLIDGQTYLFELFDGRYLIRTVHVGLHGDYFLTCIDRRNQIDISFRQEDVAIREWPKTGRKPDLRLVGQIPWIFKKVRSRLV